MPGSAAVLAVRRLAATERRDPGTQSRLAEVLHDVLAPVFENLREATGDDGCSALSSRAFARTEWEHPPVTTVRGPTDYEVPLANIVAAIAAHGTAATASAVEALLVALFEILARIIGEDMAISIMDHERPRPGQGDGVSS
jgi:hypothetical protein